MAQAKVYVCPVHECHGEFTTAQIKKNDRRCMTCETPLEHKLDRTSGKLVHKWIVDDSRQALYDVPKPGKATFEILPRLPDAPDNAPDVYKRIDPLAKEGDSTYRVIYKNRYGYTTLRCPQCGKFLHTTNLIAGSRQGTLCRSSSQTDAGWEKCKIRTDFIFLRNGEVYDANSN